MHVQVFLLGNARERCSRPDSHFSLTKAPCRRESPSPGWGRRRHPTAASRKRVRLSGNRTCGQPTYSQDSWLCKVLHSADATAPHSQSARKPRARSPILRIADRTNQSVYLIAANGVPQWRSPSIRSRAVSASGDISGLGRSDGLYMAIKAAAAPLAWCSLLP